MLKKHKTTVYHRFFFVLLYVFPSIMKKIKLSIHPSIIFCLCITQSQGVFGAKRVTNFQHVLSCITADEPTIHLSNTYSNHPSS